MSPLSSKKLGCLLITVNSVASLYHDGRACFQKPRVRRQTSKEHCSPPWQRSIYCTLLGNLGHAIAVHLFRETYYLIMLPKDSSWYSGIFYQCGHQTPVFLFLVGEFGPPPPMSNSFLHQCCTGLQAFKWVFSAT